jgi:hypothetical protein
MRAVLEQVDHLAGHRHRMQRGVSPSFWPALEDEVDGSLEMAEALP